MARIRTIKPEFPQSESMGRISRDARLLFIEMWTLADDSGRLRGNSRMLASLLFPYDEDAGGLISTWMDELKREGCIVCYLGPDGSSYVSICNWESHQKIDKPTKSKLPEPPSIVLANPREVSASPRECSSEDQGSRTKEGIKDQGEGAEKKPREPDLKVFEDPKFKTEWNRWKRHRNEKHKPLGAVEEESQLYDLVRFGLDEAIEIVKYSVQRGALNLILNGDHKGRPPTSRGSGSRSGPPNLEECVLK